MDGAQQQSTTIFVSTAIHHVDLRSVRPGGMRIGKETGSGDWVVKECRKFLYWLSEKAAKEHDYERYGLPYPCGNVNLYELNRPFQQMVEWSKEWAKYEDDLLEITHQAPRGSRLAVAMNHTTNDRQALWAKYQALFPEKVIVLDLCWAAQEHYREWKRWQQLPSPIKEAPSRT
jgi:hypothetical protein